MTRQAQEREENEKEKLVSLISADPKLSKKKLAEEVGVSASRIDKLLKLLVDEGTLRREGTAQKGSWIINV